MSESTNEPVMLTSNQLIELIRPVILAHTKHEGYTDQIIQMIDDGTRLRVIYEALSPAGTLFSMAIGLLDPVDPLIVEAMTGILMDKLRITEPPADLPARDAWLRTRNELLKSQAEAIELGIVADVEVHSINASEMEVDWTQLANLEGLGESNG